MVLLDVRNGNGIALFLKHLVFRMSGQYFLMIPMTVGAILENLVMKAIIWVPSL